MNNYKVDLIVPVFNERENFESFYKFVNLNTKSDWKIYLIYDIPEDTTLKSATPISEKDPRVKLILNKKKGVINALKSGFEVVEADAVLCIMVDDPQEVIEKIDKMVEIFYTDKATIVAASRYMTGGGHRGGPLLKGLLSRLAGNSLYWLINLPIHDATYNTKIYRKSFIQKIKIESQKGFEIALELTIKAHLQKEKIVEIPVIWTERVIGKSKFKLLKWLPEYFRWYWYGIKNYWLINFQKNHQRP